MLLLMLILRVVIMMPVMLVMLMLMLELVILILTSVLILVLVVILTIIFQAIHCFLYAKFVKSPYFVASALSKICQWGFTCLATLYSYCRAARQAQFATSLPLWIHLK